MTIALEPADIRTAWERGVERGVEELDASARYRGDARGEDMNDLTDILTFAVDAVGGVKATTCTVIDELHGGMEDCLLMWENSQGQMVATFNALEGEI